MARVLVPLADGCEEIETVTIIDVLRRGGVEVISASLGETTIKASRGVTLVADTTLDHVISEHFDMVVLPGGGPGADRLQADQRVLKLLKDTSNRGDYTAAICAAPKVLATAGLLSGRNATGYPGVLEAMSLDDVTLSTEAVVKNGKLITSQGPGTAMDFALALLAELTDEATMQQVAVGLRP
ncbi:MAG: DJ-1 family glyoxalase III [Gammaproteobacteria bacterium]